MGALAAFLAKAWAIFEEVAPVAQFAVALVEAKAPAGTSGTAKFAAASKAITDTVNAASAGESAFVQTRAAVASGDAALVGTAFAHAIETTLSIFKTFNLFPKAGVVQAALPLGAAPAAEQPGG